jgi:hypothetical protein
MPQADDQDSLEALSSQIVAAAKRTGFALMKANYVERDAPELPGGKIRGLAAEARDSAVSLRDSIWTRFDSLRFHHSLLLRLNDDKREKLNAQKPGSDDFDLLWASTWYTHYLFDDVVFNSISLFDYLGNAVWFAFHGQNHIKKKWNKAYSAAKGSDMEVRLKRGPRILGSKTGAVIRRAHESFVNALYEYRSDLIHNRIDGPNVFSHEFWEQTRQPGFRASLPKGYVHRLRVLLPNAKAGNPDVDVASGAEHLILRTGHVTLELLGALQEDIGWTEGEPLTILS